MRKKGGACAYSCGNSINEYSLNLTTMSKDFFAFYFHLKENKEKKELCRNISVQVVNRNGKDSPFRVRFENKGKDCLLFKFQFCSGI